MAGVGTISFSEWLDERGRGKAMKWVAPIAVLSAIAVLLISCGGNSGGDVTGPNGRPVTNAPACDTVQSATCHSISVTQSDGTIVTRYYVLHVPTNFPANLGALVVSLHGTGEGGLEYEQHTQLDATADQTARTAKMQPRVNGNTGRSSYLLKHRPFASLTSGTTLGCALVAAKSRVSAKDHTRKKPAQGSC